ncbi:MAG TPA: ATP-binding protein, partial [Salinibacter sp.]|nr:ATP-binding protein [Salinibacter sp.]
HDVVRSIRPDPRQPETVLWIGTAGGGLNRFDVENERFTHITEADGLPNNVVYGILPDDDGHLWLSTNRGLSRFDPQTGTAKNYDVDDGLQSNEFNSGAYFKNVSGTLFFGGLYGFNFFDPGAVKDNPQVPPIALTGVSLSNHPLSPSDSTTLLEKDIVETEALTLSYRDNVITFTFAALDFSAPSNNRYAYLMEGFNDTWVDAGTANTATYTNLPPGQYTFRVKGTNNDGVWNETGTALALTITPPWWQTRWAYGIYALIVIGGIFTVDRVQRRRLIRRERERARLREAEIHAAAAERQSATLQHLDEMKSRFFANVSHEFRTPLTLTIGPLDDLRRGTYGALPEDAVKQAELAHQNARRVLDLINELLDLSKLEAGGLTLRLQQSDLGAFLRQAAATHESLAVRQQITFRCDVPEAPVLIVFDPSQLERVFANLLSNAFKFTPAGGSVRLSLRDDDPETDEVVVRLRDTGPGIPADEIDRVFDRFYQASESSTRLQPGTGIGLALAWELVHLHAGTLDVESEEGFGSTFLVHLPREHPDESVLVASHAPTQTADGEPDASSLDDALASLTTTDTVLDPNRPTILVVEDNEAMRSYICGHLAEHYRVVAATNGRDGLSTAQRTPPDLVVSDVMMPEMDGYALCKALKQDPTLDYVPVLLLTAKAGPQDRLDGLAEGADAYLVKPFDLRELFAQIDNLLASRKRLQERFGTTLPSLHASKVKVPSTDAAFLERTRLLIEIHLDDDAFSVEALAEEMGLSRVHLYRRLRALIDRSPSELIRSIRLERAAQLLALDAGAISEVAYGVGFKSVSHFSRAFREQYGQSPTEYAANTSASENNEK